MTSVFFLFRDSPFFSLSQTTVSNISCSSFSLSAIRTVSSAYLILFMLYPPNFIPGMPSRARMIISLYMEKRSGDNTHPCLTPLFMSWKALKSFHILIAAVCSQYIFRTILRSLPSMFKLSRIDIISSCLSLSKAFVFCVIYKAYIQIFLYFYGSFC